MALIIVGERDQDHKDQGQNGEDRNGQRGERQQGNVEFLIQ